MTNLAIPHKIAGVTGMALIATFWTATAVSEIFLTHAEIIWVKTAILYALPLLVLSLAAAGGSGARLAGPSPNAWARRKQKRMAFAAANGLLILIPAAVFLWWKASAGEFDSVFYVVQIVELIAGPVNLALLGLNARDGFKLARAKRKLQQRNHARAA